jgi:Protein of unknown function (DUF3147)
MSEIIIRFVIGGLVVSSFAVLGEIFRPKSFAGIFGAAPSVALATVGLTIAKEGKAYASLEAHSMIFGAIAFFVYACVASFILMRYMRYKTHALATVWPVRGGPPVSVNNPFGFSGLGGGRRCNRLILLDLATESLESITCGV